MKIGVRRKPDSRNKRSGFILRRQPFTAIQRIRHDLYNIYVFAVLVPFFTGSWNVHRRKRVHGIMHGCQSEPVHSEVPRIESLRSWTWL